MVRDTVVGKKVKLVFYFGLGSASTTVLREEEIVGKKVKLILC